MKLMSNSKFRRECVFYSLGISLCKLVARVFVFFPINVKMDKLKWCPFLFVGSHMIPEMMYDFPKLKNCA